MISEDCPASLGRKFSTEPSPLVPVWKICSNFIQYPKFEFSGHLWNSGLLPPLFFNPCLLGNISKILEVCSCWLWSQPLIYFSITVVRFLFYSPSPPPVFRGINWRSINCMYLNCTIWVLTYLSTCESVTIVKIMGIYTTSQSSLVSLYSPFLPHLQVITHLACVTKG